MQSSRAETRLQSRSNDPSVTTTTRERDEDASEVKFRGLLESAPDAVVIVDATGLIQIVNRQTEVLFGYPRAKLLGQPVSLSPMTSGQGETLIISNIRDVTARKMADERLRAVATDLARSNAELEHFAYVASHDLQEPLRMVASYTQLLARRYKGKLDEDADEFIGFAVDGARRMQELINDLLAYSRAGTQPLQLQAVDTTQLVDQVMNDLAAAIQDSHASVTRDKLPTVQGDPTQLRQLFQNLLANGIKFHRSDEAPRVHVSATLEHEQWSFAVRDNGIGIEPRYLERIFVLFQRLHTRADYPGTGIGLAICKKIVERHGGQIGVEAAPGHGTTFWFTLPFIGAGKVEP